MRQRYSTIVAVAVGVAVVAIAAIFAWIQTS
jgi:hypothetical protein